MKLNHFCIIFYCLLYISQIVTCPTCVAEVKSEDDKKQQLQKRGNNHEKN